MPKDSSQPLDDGPAVKPRGSGKKANALKRNMACDSCRKRRLRCDAAKPNCGTCIRSYNHVMSHLKAGQTPPDYPVCNYEDHPASSNASDPSAVSARPASATASSGGSAPASEPKEKVNELESRVQQLEGMLKMAVGAQQGAFRFGGGESSTSAAPPSNGPPTFAFNGGAPSPALGGLPGFNFGPSFDQMRAGEGRVLPPPTWGGQPFDHLGQGAQSPAPFAASSVPFPQAYPSPSPAPPSTYKAELSFPQNPYANRTGTLNYTPFPHPFHTAQPTPAVVPPPPSAPAYMAPQQPLWAFPPTLTNPARETFQTFPPSSSHTSDTIPTPTSSSANPPMPEGAFISMASSDHMSEENGKHKSQTSGPTIEDLLDNVPGADAAAVEDLETDIWLQQLLWPSWPAHLPSPGRFDHIVESFFHNVPFASHIINKARLLTRLRLPPKHKDFPHPALLHAICCVTSRYIGGVVLLPTAPCPLMAKPRFPGAELNSLPIEHTRPIWDGYGNPPTAGLTPGRDEDFGQIHLTWSRMYIDKTLDHPQCWMDICLSLALLCQYCHQHARWLDGFSLISIMTRLAVPLKLNTRAYTDRRAISKMSLTTEPKDDIEKIERQNLFWMIFSIDTWSSASSGWQGTLAVEDLWACLPTANASYPPEPVREATQFADSPDLFFHHPPEHASPYAISMKGTLLLRKAVDFVRRADMSNLEVPRAHPMFNELDDTITTFRTAMPAELKRPYIPSVEGFAADRDTLMARALPHSITITLHERYWDASDPFDPSIPKLREAIRGILETVHSTLHTTFDFGLFHPFMTFAWHLAARTLLRLLQAQLSRGEFSELPSLLADVDVLRTAMRRVGDRIPIGHRQESMIKALLDEIVATSVVGPGENDGNVMVSVVAGMAWPVRLKVGGEGTAEPAPKSLWTKC